MVLDSVTSAPQCIRQPRPRVYLKEGTYHTRLFITLVTGHIQFYIKPVEVFRSLIDSWYRHAINKATFILLFSTLTGAPTGASYGAEASLCLLDVYLFRLRCRREVKKSCLRGSCGSDLRSRLSLRPETCCSSAAFCASSASIASAISSASFSYRFSHIDFRLCSADDCPGDLPARIRMFEITNFDLIVGIGPPGGPILSHWGAEEEV